MISDKSEKILVPIIALVVLFVAYLMFGNVIEYATAKQNVNCVDVCLEEGLYSAGGAWDEPEYPDVRGNFPFINTEYVCSCTTGIPAKDIAVDWR